MNTQTNTKRSGQSPPFTGLAALAALVSFGLLPAALLLGTSTVPFLALTYAHTSLLLLAAISAVRYFVYHALQTKSSPVLPVSLFLIFTIVTLLNAAPPPTDPAALAGPLYTIKHWLLSDSMTAIRWNFDSYAPHLPSLTQLGFMPYLGHATFPIYSLLTVIVASAAISMLTHSWTHSSLLALYAFLLVLTMPLFQKLAVNYSLDSTLAMYSALALLYLLRWFKNEQPLRSIIGLGLVSGALAAAGFRGLGFATLIVVALPFCAISKRVSTGRLFLALLLVPALIGVGVLPWLFRNFMWTMNPIFPILSGYIDTSGGGISYQSIEPFLIQRWVKALDYSVLDLVLLPIHLLLPGPLATVQLGARLSPILLLGFISFKFLKKGEIAVPLTLAGLYTLAALVLFPPNIPALTPVVPAFCFLTMVGLHQAGLWCKQYYRLLAHILIGLHTVYALYFAFELVTDLRPFAYIQSKDTDKYLGSHIEEYPLIVRLNRILPPYAGGNLESTAYLIGLTPAFYYYDFDIRSDSTKRPSFLLEQLRAHDSADELVSAFLHRGIKLLFARKAILTESIEKFSTPRERRIWLHFSEQHLETIFEDETFAVWRIVREADTEETVVEPSESESQNGETDPQPQAEQ